MSRIFNPRHRFIFLLLVVFNILPPGMAEAQRPAPPAVTSPVEQLDRLFAALGTAATEAEGRTLEADIWKLWSYTRDADIGLLMRRAQVFASSGQMDASLGVIDKVVALSPRFVEGWNRRATVLYLMGRYDESIADIGKVLALEPRHFGALAGLGMIHLQRQNWKGALEAFLRATKVHPWLKERHLISALEQKVKGRAL
ncbi:MAG TPA: tetratricopeptide repeat protein [Hyphomicrobiaceae bacterium]|nr:tetratricopeptide repeat protein [Hyphomicrobiaceae bacterium]